MFGVGCLVSGFSSIQPTEMALQYNNVLKTVVPVPLVAPGLTYIGPWNSLIKYPKTIRTIEFSGAYGTNPLLDARTSDGLPLTLGVSFQYRLDPTKIYDLYRAYEQQSGQYERIFTLLATHVITEHATRYSAYEFFNDKMRIADTMRTSLNAYFSANLFSAVLSLQINEDTLPTAFTDAVLTAATEKQNITRMEKFRESQVVNFQTDRIVAWAQANVTVNGAMGQQHRVMQNGRADAAIIETYVEAEKTSYKSIGHQINLEGQDLIHYMWYDSLAGGGVGASISGVDTSVLVGVDPAAYMSDPQSR